MRLAVAVLIAGCGCGRLAFDPLGGNGGGPPGDGPGATLPGDTLPTTGRHWVNRNLATPGLLIGARAVFHSRRHTVMLYGGDHATGIPPTQPSSAMWEYDGTAWTLVCDPCAPGPRFAPAMAYDADRDRIVLYGGLDKAGALATHYEWDGTAWSQIQIPAGQSPGARGMAQMAYDEYRRRIVMFGGGVDTVAYSAAVFEYDGAMWTQPAVASPGPEQLGGQGMAAAWNATTRRVDVLEDHGNSGDRDGAWSWDGTAWLRLCETCTGIPRHDASIAWEPSPPRTFVIGGDDGTVGSEIDGTWQLDAAGTRELSQLPSKRDSAAVAYDARRDVIVLYGGNGRGCGGNCSETWELVRD